MTGTPWTRSVVSLWIGTAGQPAMTLKIAIQPDEVVHPNGKRQSFSKRWAELAQAKNIDVVPVDVFAEDAMARISECNAFMWRCPCSAHIRAYAKRFLYALEAGSGIPVFPSLKSSWYFEDKLAQRYFFSAADIPCARTDIFWTREAAEQFAERATYPFVLKLAGGHQSANVRLVRNRREATFYVEELFGHGVASLGYRPASLPRVLLRRLRAAGSAMVLRHWVTDLLHCHVCYCGGCGPRPRHSKDTIRMSRVPMQNCITATSTHRNSCPATSSKPRSSLWATAPLRSGGLSNRVISARAAVPGAWIGAPHRSARM